MAAPLRGYFGKVPASRDFVFHGLPMRTSGRWADHMAEWFALGARAHGSDWQQHVLASPVWRFALDRDVISAEGWIGLMAGSIDGVGRLFPFAAMVSADLDLGRGVSLDGIDGVLNRLELPFLEFIENEAAGLSTELVGALDELVGGLSASRFSAPDGKSMLPGAADIAAALLSDIDPLQDVRLGVAGQTSEASAPYALWWHPGTSGAVRCVSRGILPARHAVALFDSDWQRHGWEPR
jgi:type VI secretion system ImpM family protein